jgi:hypothetical protein
LRQDGELVRFFLAGSRTIFDAIYAADDPSVTPDGKADATRIPTFLSSYVPIVSAAMWNRDIAHH